MTKRDNLLIEIQTEELPPKSLRKLSQAFRDQIDLGLQQAHLDFDSIKALASPRRLAVYVSSLENKQAEQIIERKGPSLRAAFDESGQPTKACLGFAKSCGVKVEDLQTVKTDKGDWLTFTKKEPGKTLQAILPELVSQALEALPIPKNMRWGHNVHEFVRPVHGVIMLYGKTILPGKILGVETSNVTRGHRFLSSGPVRIKSADQYEKQLEKAFVIVDLDERKKNIEQQIQSLEKEHSVNVMVEEDLLDEVTSLVEWPVALYCQFKPDFLNTPKEALMSAMQNHQKSFTVTNSSRDMQANFVTISNIKSKDPKQVIKGNERVMEARLSDASFFYQVDLKTPLISRLENLKSILYQKQLGSLYDKAKRLEILSQKLATELNIDANKVTRAALLAKCDLASEMVFEFPELQGTMGGYYAVHDGEPEDVACAIREHYLPKFSGDVTPSNDVGCLVALADKIDTLVGIFGINQRPTGDKDPFALRRAAIGLIRIIAEKTYVLDLKKIIEFSVSTYKNALPNKDVVLDVLAFVNDRQRVWILEKGISPDVWASVAALKLTRITDIISRISAVQEFKALDAAESLTAANKRVSNILSKQVKALDGLEVDSSLFEHESEKCLANLLKQKRRDIEPLYQRRCYSDVLMQLADLKQPVDDFFDHVLVMTDNEAVQQNRLVLLNQLRQLFLKVADVALLQ